MTKPLPCPFCQSELQPLREPGRDRIITYIHPYGIECFLAPPLALEGEVPGFVARWNQRATVPGAPVCYEVLDGVPVFNNAGQGTQADANFLNKCFAYLLDSWKKNSK